MATILNLEAHRVETAQAAYVPGKTRNLPEPGVRIVRKADRAFVEFGNESELALGFCGSAPMAHPKTRRALGCRTGLSSTKRGRGICWRTVFGRPAVPPRRICINSKEALHGTVAGQRRGARVRDEGHR
jgi:hypothetical protein